MQTSLDEIESAIEEAERVRARHDGVHSIHSYVMVLRCCYSLAREGAWCEATATIFRETVIKVRCIDRTGFSRASCRADTIAA